MRDFGNRCRLLTSSERQSLWSIVNLFSDEEIKNINSPYYGMLSLAQAKLDNIKL